MKIATRERQGFTIVELLVSMALIVLIMAILSEAFVAGLESFRYLKAIGDTQERLRVGAAPLRRDILSRHFDGDQKVSTLPADLPGAGGVPVGLTEGFFRIEQGAIATSEGSDPDGLPSSRSTSCLLHMSVRLPNPARREDYASARITPIPSPATELETDGPLAFRQAGVALGTWVEVIYFLYPTGENAGGTPLYSLHRRQKVLASGAVTQNSLPPANRLPATNPGPFGEVSTVVVANPQPYLHCCTPADLLRPDTSTGLYRRSLRQVPEAPPVGYNWNALGPIPTGMSGDNTQIGDDLLLTDVLSFEVEVLRRDRYEFLPLSAFGNDYVRGGRWVFDTSDAALRPGPANAPNRNLLNLRGIKVTIRVWDFKSQQSRQISVIDEL